MREYQLLIGDSLTNAQMKAGGQDALNTVPGNVVGGAGNTLLSKLPGVTGKIFEPTAADTIGGVGARMVQGAGTMAAFKPAFAPSLTATDLLVPPALMPSFSATLLRN